MNPNNTTVSAIPEGRAGWTIEEWCNRWRIKRGLYYKLADRPEVIRIGSKVIITAQADEEWHRRQSAKARAAVEGRSHQAA
jgi:hypothetical protein